MVLAGRRSQFGGEGLDREGVRYVRDRTVPADLGVRLRLAVLELMFLTSKGVSTRPIPFSSGISCLGSGAKSDKIVGATLL